MKTLFIAQDIEEDRIAFMERWLAASGLHDWKRMPGVSVECFGNQSLYSDAKRMKRFGYSMSLSEIGCFLAHRNCWEYALNTGEHVLVLESDVGLLPEINLSDLLDGLIENAGVWDIVRLHGIFERNELVTRQVLPLINTPAFELRQSLGDPMGAGAYLISAVGAKKLLEASRSFYQPVDVFLGSYWMHRCVFRVVKPYPFFVQSFRSTIGRRVRPRQNIIERLKIESCRCFDDVRRLIYLPFHFFR